MTQRLCKMCGDWHELDQPWPVRCLTGPEKGSGPQVIRDITSYKSMINGQMITSRSQHRTHLKDHGCIEVGNDTSHLKPRQSAPVAPNRKESLHKMLADVGDRDIKKIIQTEIRNRR